MRKKEKRRWTNREKPIAVRRKDRNTGRITRKMKKRKSNTRRAKEEEEAVKREEEDEEETALVAAPGAPHKGDNGEARHVILALGGGS